ncbi:MAG: hypothetical protein HN570_06820 [Verrucomicrobia bacterium]|jgi:hypothetical protein|nr:hypothetical protein [Verrucomicrobiota bacterium]MDA7663409.1 hypothetical protein [Akkermansiaceae bacterium]MBT6168601.1 hypothetical protein [Verrucomicrobiota bacterium]MBT7970694.1 hypothetical protein [Verrucomicrobiota bacterium]MDB4698148.1 hypothetical protein [Akkermansiaceae bacterium]
MSFNFEGYNESPTILLFQQKNEALLISLPKLILTSYAETLLTTDNLAIQKSLIDGTHL